MIETTVELLSHRDIFRTNLPAPHCTWSGKLMLTTRQAHRAVRLMRTRGNKFMGHYRCPDCLTRHLTSMERWRWPVAPPLNSPLVLKSEDQVA